MEALASPAPRPAREAIEVFVNRLFRPKITSLKNPELVFEIDGFEPINLYPFLTINDLLTQIYIRADRKEEYHPENLCLLREDRIGGLLHAQYTVGRSLTLLDPLTRIQKGPDSRFVTVQGEPTEITFVPQGDVLLESAFGSGTVRLRLFLYRDILAAYTGIRPLSSAVWNGCIRPYFPTRLRLHEDGSLPAESLDFAPTRVKAFSERLAILDRMEEALEEKDQLRKPGNTTRGDPVKFSSVKYIRFNWDSAPQNSSKSPYEAFDLESFFFDLPVSTTIPYVRFMSKVKKSSISKVHVTGVIPIPSIDPPSLLESWAKAKSPRPEGDAILAKVQLGSFYMTWYIYEDGSSQLTIQPPEGVRSLTRQDVGSLTDSLLFMETVAPKLAVNPSAARPPKEPFSLFSHTRIQLQDAYMILNLWLEKDDPNPLTRESMRRILPFFKVFFQDTSSPIKEQNPLVYLRYKAVSNFVTPARDMTFLRRVLELRRIQGAGTLAELVKYYKEEFNVPESVAQDRVLAFQSKLADVIEIQTDSLQREFTQAENPGIDTAAFGKFPYYYFHLYRLDSVETLERILTALSLLVSLTPEAFEGLTPSEEVDQEQEQEQEQEVVEDAVEEEPQAVEEEVQPEYIPDAVDELGDFMGFEEEHKTPPLTQILKEDTATVTATAPAPAPLQKKGDEDVMDAEEIKSQPARTYFLERLKFHDKRLFTYTKTHPSLKKYASMCAGNALKQPAVVSEADYEKMKDIYEKDVNNGKLVWIEYPLTGEAPSVPEGAESITTLRYGTSLSAGQANIYLCSRYWCRKDEIVVLEADFKSTKDRKDQPKPANTCPFCRDGLVLNREQTVKGESVIERTIKDKSENKRHVFVRFLKSSPHPDGSFLPCCFIKDQPIFSTHPAFAKIEPVQVESTPALVNYRETFSRLHKDVYIASSTKLPLEIEGRRPQVGLVPPSLDRYFHQTKERLTEKHGTMLNLKEGAMGFLRIGVENRTRYQADAFLSALAPYYGYNTAQDMKQELMTHVTPNVFIALGYGNLLFDYYDPSDAAPTTNELLRFVAKQFATEHGTGPQREALVRAYKAYQRFTDELQSPTHFKEYRQYAHLLSLPNLLRWKHSDGTTTHANGIVFVVLEVSSNTLTVRCPPYGLTEEQTRRADLAFILYYDSGIWEPLFYTRNRLATAQIREIHEVTMVFSRETYAEWPSVVKSVASEFERMCKRDGLGLYTEVPDIQSGELLPVDRLRRLSVGPTGIVRDSFNHVSGLAFSSPSGVVIVPAVDDGTVLSQVATYLDWRNLRGRLAKEADVEEFYTTHVDPLAKELGKDYSRVGRIRLDKTGLARDFTTALLRLKGGMFVPVRVPTAGKEEGEILESEAGDFLPWMDDMKLMFPAPAATAKTLDSREFEEIYQHLRLTFANWFAITASATLRQEVNSILFDAGRMRLDLSVMDKRRQLFILLGNEILSWMDSTVPLRTRPQTLKRVNCILQPKESCSSACIWKEESSQCLLHTPQVAPIAGHTIDAQRFMVRRLLEELIRFPLKREELLKAKVPTRIPLVSSIRMGDQYIMRETTPAWSEFLRMEWANPKHEVAKYPEEILAASGTGAPEEAAAVMPPLLTKWLGDQADFTYHPLTQINEVFDLPAERYENLLTPAGEFVSQAALTEFATYNHLSLIQVNLTKEPILIARYKKGVPFYVFVCGEGIGLLSLTDSLDPIPLARLPVPVRKKAALSRLIVT